MRTKTMLLSAVIGAACLATSIAQTVYSVNVVGYINVTLQPGFNLVANQLNTTNNTVASLLSGLPYGTQVYKWTGTSFVSYLWDDVDGWLPNGLASVNPGEGAFIKNNTTTNITLTFVGEVLTGSSTNALVTGYQIVSCKLPTPGTPTELGLPVSPGEQLYKYDARPGFKRYNSFLYDDVDGWLPSEPTFDVGEAFFIRKAGAANWLRSFDVSAP